MTFTMTVYGLPIPQPRVKATIRGKHAGVYTPTTKQNGRSNGIAEFKSDVRREVVAQLDGRPLLTGPLRLDLSMVFPRQAAKVWKSRPMPRYLHVTRPDADNVLKAIKDAMKGVLWLDDCQVCAGSFVKWHGAGDEAPHCRIVVTELEE